jgi:hypothetical protein
VKTTKNIKGTLNRLKILMEERAHIKTGWHSGRM